MARPLRLIYEGAVYHITARGNERKAIFKDDQDRERFLMTLSESLQRYEVRLYLFCCMPNHIHLVLETPRCNVSRFMQRLQTAYAIYFNRKHRRHGHLWQGRFSASLVEQDAYILRLSRYVHLNPVFTKQARRLSERDRVRMVRTYPWSSYRSYIGSMEPLSFIDERPILAMMSRTKRAPRASYRRFVEAGVRDVDAAFVNERKQSRLCIGSESYRERVASAYEAMVQDAVHLEDVSFRQSPRLCSVKEALAIVCDVVHIDPADLFRRSRHNLYRPFAAQALVDYCGLTQRQVAQELGLTSGAAVSHQMKRLAEAVEQDGKVKRKRETIAKRIQALVR